MIVVEMDGIAGRYLKPNISRLPHSSANTGYNLFRGGNIELILRDVCDIIKSRRVIAMIEENELDSTCGISDDELTKRFVEAVRIANEIKKIKGVPIQKYDFELNKSYLEYPDGRREYAEEVR